MTGISKNFEGPVFHSIFVRSPFFVFSNTKSSSQIWIEMSNGENFYRYGFKKIDYFWNSSSQILVFDKGQVKWLQTRKRKFKKKYQRT